jgi:hypothetical protein
MYHAWEKYKIPVQKSVRKTISETYGSVNQGVLNFYVLLFPTLKGVNDFSCRFKDGKMTAT